MLVYSPRYDKHQDKYHIENKSRTDAIINNFSSKNIFKNLDVLDPTPATLNQILSVHDPQHVHFIEEFCRAGGGNIDFDTYATPQTYETALLSAGGAITASESVLNGEKWAFSISRPPGHHATSKKSMGFCIFNNVAIAINYLKRKARLKRFCIVDFDVHYGNGTAEIFYKDPSVLYISIHQDPHTIFPGTGFIEEYGADKGEGYTLNIPLPPKSGDTEYIWILKEVLEPVLKEFRPQVLFADAGFDAHLNDPLSRMNVTEYFYSWIGQYLMEKFGSVISLLEGGYDLEALASSSLNFIISMDTDLIYENSTLQDDFMFKDEIEKIYLNNKNINSKLKEILFSIKSNFSPYFSF